MGRSEVYGPLDDSEDRPGGRSRARKNPVEEIRAIRDNAVHIRTRAEQHDLTAGMQLSRMEQHILGIRDEEMQSRPASRSGHARAIDSGGGRRARRARKPAVPYDDVILDEDMRAPEEPAGEPVNVIPARQGRPCLCYTCTCVASLASMVLAFDVVAGHPIEQVLQSMNVTSGVHLPAMPVLWGDSPPPPPPLLLKVTVPRMDAEMERSLHAPHPSTPPPPPPYQLWPGNLDSAKCRAMLRDPQHVFRRMWSVEGWAKQELKGACWDSKRDNAKTRQPMHTYFEEVLAGTYCGSNWYEGNPGLLGLQGRPPTSFYIDDAPALFGVDADIGSVCQNAMRASGMTPSNAFGHSGNCVAGGYNILNLNSPRVPYNLCRNLEWQVCAARNQIPAQGESAVMFATSPNSLDLDGARSVGKCAGWRPEAGSIDGGYGYANADIFYLESCLFGQICDNGPEIFDDVDWLKHPFKCSFNATLFRELEAILSEPADLGVDPEECQQFSNSADNYQPEFRVLPVG